MSRAANLWSGALLFAIALACASVLPPAQLTVLNNVVVLALFAMATNLLLGTAGLVSFGQGCFYGLGAYTVGMAGRTAGPEFWPAAIAAPFIGALAAFLVGALVLRSRCWYFALLTMAFSQLFFTIAEKAYDYTQGDTGIFGPMVPDVLADPRHGSLFILLVAAVAMVALAVVDASPLGLVLRAIRDRERRVLGLGVNVYRTQLLAFTISGWFCALAGVLAAVNQQAAYPGLLDWTQSGDAVLVCVVGGMYAFLGPVLGAIVYQLAVGKHQHHEQQHQAERELPAGGDLHDHVVTQITQVFARMSVLDCVVCAVIARRRGAGRFWSIVSRAERDEAMALLEAVGLLELAAQRAGTLSHGDQRVLEVALALATAPRLLLLDEPTAGMSPLETERTVGLVRRLARERG